MKKRFIIDNDGSNYFIYNFTAQNYADRISGEVASLPACVTTVTLCPGAGNYWYPTKIGRIHPNSIELHGALEKGEDPFRCYLEELKNSGREAFISVRMNDVHSPVNVSQGNVPLIRQMHPDAIVETNPNPNEWTDYCLDYSRDEVREYMLSLLQEMVELYSDVIDGILLDWMRFPRFLSGDAQEVWEKRILLNDFITKARQITSGLELAARVPAIFSGAKHIGLDLDYCFKNELFNFIVACPFLTSDFYINTKEFKEVMKKQIPVYGGCDIGHTPQRHCPESLRGIVAGLNDSGCDGIFLFNFPCWREYLGDIPWHWLNELSTVQAPMLLSAPHKLYRKEGIDAPGIIPTSLEPEEKLEVNIFLPSCTDNAQKILCLIHSCADVDLMVNGEGSYLCPERNEALFVEFVDQGQWKNYRPKIGETRIFKMNNAHSGNNTLSIKNISKGSICIGRINIGIWGHKEIHLKSAVTFKKK